MPPVSLSLSYTPQELYSVVADVNSYKFFLPWCKDSKYLREGPKKSIARLVVGFPPLLESYNALVLHSPPHSMRVGGGCVSGEMDGGFILTVSVCVVESVKLSNKSMNHQFPPPPSSQTLATNGRLFTHLENMWQFRSGPDTDSGPTTFVSFWVQSYLNEAQH